MRTWPVLAQNVAPTGRPKVNFLSQGSLKLSYYRQTNRRYRNYYHATSPVVITTTAAEAARVIMTKSCATAKSTARPSCLVGVLYDIYRETINRSTANWPLLGNWSRKLPISEKWRKIMAITPFKVIQGHRFWYQSKAHKNFLLVVNTKISCTVSKLRLIICQIFANDRRSLHFNVSLGGDPL